MCCQPHSDMSHFTYFLCRCFVYFACVSISCRVLSKLSPCNNIWHLGLLVLTEEGSALNYTICRRERTPQLRVMHQQPVRMMMQGHLVGTAGGVSELQQPVSFEWSFTLCNVTQKVLDCTQKEECWIQNMCKWWHCVNNSNIKIATYFLLASSALRLQSHVSRSDCWWYFWK